MNPILGFISLKNTSPQTVNGMSEIPHKLLKFSPTLASRLFYLRDCVTHQSVSSVAVMHEMLIGIKAVVHQPATLNKTLKVYGGS